MVLRLPKTTLFPYTTLFRSTEDRAAERRHELRPAGQDIWRSRSQATVRAVRQSVGSQGGSRARGCCLRRRASSDFRSEEHTSELQSQSNLVCRLQLEKKKKTLLIYLATRFDFVLPSVAPDIPLLSSQT